MELFFMIFGIVVILISLNLNVGFSIEYDILKNIGKIKLKLFKIPIFVSEISLISGYFNFIRKNKKVLQIKIDIFDKNFKFLKDIGSYIFKKVFIINFDSKFIVGGFEADKISILAGAFVVLEGMARSYMLSKTPDTTITNNTKVNYNKNNLIIGLKINILITIFDFIWAIIRALVKRSLYGKTTKFGRERKFTY